MQTNFPDDKKGNADFCAYFFLKAKDLLNEKFEWTRFEYKS
ncbi:MULTISPECIES: hypothetical protein [Aphanizomenon]|jgi:hypothetical protein|nr:MULTISPECIES: hypothetical protein [Aphanizomenon]MDK2411034.1 hypothetical protein [Aphanizomenon sp. 202]MDK2461412.1 hypothetical protein [Aphanizomenon sp. PH219]